MKAWGVKLFSAFWLVFVLPVLGVFPLLLLTGATDPYAPAGRQQVEVLRAIRGLVLPDPAPGFSPLELPDLAPAWLWVCMVVIVFAVSGLSLYQLWRVSRIRAV
jgi:hypothetical protein